MTIDDPWVTMADQAKGRRCEPALTRTTPGRGALSWGMSDDA